MIYNQDLMTNTKTLRFHWNKFVGKLKPVFVLRNSRRTFYAWPIAHELVAYVRAGESKRTKSFYYSVFLTCIVTEDGRTDEWTDGWTDGRSSRGNHAVLGRTKDPSP
jgi:hypothetical protein